MDVTQTNIFLSIMGVALGMATTYLVMETRYIKAIKFQRALSYEQGAQLAKKTLIEHQGYAYERGFNDGMDYV